MIDWKEDMYDIWSLLHSEIYCVLLIKHLAITLWVLVTLVKMYRMYCMIVYCFIKSENLIVHEKIFVNFYESSNIIC